VGKANGNRQVEVKTLRGAPFKINLVGAHSFSTKTIDR
jgi:hypothetical protein